MARRRQTSAAAGRQFAATDGMNQKTPRHTQMIHGIFTYINPVYDPDVGKYNMDPMG